MTPVQHQTFHISYLAKPCVLARSRAAAVAPPRPLTQPLSLLIFISLVCVDRSRTGGGIGQSADIYPVCLWLRWFAVCVSCDRLGFVLSLSADHHQTMMGIARDKLATYVE